MYWCRSRFASLPENNHNRTREICRDLPLISIYILSSRTTYPDGRLTGSVTHRAETPASMLGRCRAGRPVGLLSKPARASPCGQRPPPSGGGDSRIPLYHLRIPWITGSWHLRVSPCSEQRVVSGRHASQFTGGPTTSNVWRTSGKMVSDLGRPDAVGATPSHGRRPCG